MTPLNAILYLWLVWVATWGAASLWSGRTVKRPGVRREVAYRLLTGAGAILIFSTRRTQAYDVTFWLLNGAAGWFLVAIAAGAVVFMWWARLHLGRMWSSSVTRKADHRLVDSGPYGIVRHPIYTGVIFGMAAMVCIRATALTVTGGVLMVTGIFIKARLEEEFLRAELGAEAYDAYARRVPMLVPFSRTSRFRRRAARRGR